MACRAERDAHGTTYIISEDKAVKTPGCQWRPGCPAVEVWWSRNGKKADETIIIRQEHKGRPSADIVEVTFGQLYDLIHALNKAVEDT